MAEAMEAHLLLDGGNGLTCSVRRLVRRKNPKRHPMTTASTDMMRSPFCLQTFFTLTQTASKATAIVSHLFRILSATHKCGQVLKSRKRLDRLIRRDSSVLGYSLDPVEVSSLMENQSRPLQDTITDSP
ncbi:unnamed protein product [Pleuronectes platessa]|uniref:Uncharacterized protein n=1 Tax=Pleuronectes platessa TaxID=8262 RepID=A0A9N7TRX9_PLEPL|nr:unnamed protein product [Pleuronectes platessa]